MKPLLIRHLSGENFGRFPVWMMRQAGRYLPEYQAIRKQNSFWEMVTKPEVACEVSLLPIRSLDVDAVIFFSDILTPPYGMGIEIELQEGIGPVVKQPLRTPSAFEIFRNFDANTHTGFVCEAQRKILERLAPEKALIGFAGAPWTVASYLIEGRGSRQFEEVKKWLYRDPGSLAAALKDLGAATARYLVAQARAGAHALQLFDTWASEIPHAFYKSHYLSILQDIVKIVRAERVPLIYFAKHSAHALDLIQKLDVDVLGADSLLPLGELEARTGGRFSLQGNLDPCVLLGDQASVRRATRELVAEARGLKRPPILNLGHGILKQTPVSNAKAFVEEAQQLWI